MDLVSLGEYQQQAQQLQCDTLTSAADLRPICWRRRILGPARLDTRAAANCLAADLRALGMPEDV
jgi:hypothetical protein